MTTAPPVRRRLVGGALRRYRENLGYTLDDALLSAQAEYQARILPALAGQLMTETTGCVHASPGRRPAGYTWGTP